MDDSLCERFFCQPTQLLHRRYEALRAVLLEHHPIAEVAQRFGYRPGSLRNLLSEFRAQCRRDQVPPFSPRHHAAGRARQVRHARSCRRSPTAVNCP
jgi:hypothetical protein